MIEEFEKAQEMTFSYHSFIGITLKISSTSLHGYYKKHQEREKKEKNILYPCLKATKTARMLYFYEFY